MRVLIDILILAMLVAMVAGAALYLHGEQRDLDKCELVHGSLKRMYEQAVFQGSLEPTPPESGFPARVRRDWFQGSPPLNPLAKAHQPWVDIAPADDAGIHPPDPILNSPTQGGFWYNPSRGVIRARVPAQFSDQATLELYNLANHATLKVLPFDGSAQRKPVALEPEVAEASANKPATTQPIVDSATPRPASAGSAKHKTKPAAKDSATSPAPARRTLSDVKPAR